MALPWRCAWVTGGSSGIGAEIARQLAEAGVKVAVSARHFGKGPTHPNISHFLLDVTDEVAVQKAVGAIEQKLGPLDLAIFAAGAYEPFKPEQWSTEVFARINAVNYLGALHAAGAVWPLMKQRGKGRIAFVASVAGYQGLPKAAYYGPTKAALINLAEALWMELRQHGVNVSVINPGFVETPMTSVNDFHMPFLMQPEEAAKLSIRGLAAGRFEVAFPRRFVLLLKSLRFMPTMWKLQLIRRLTG